MKNWNITSFVFLLIVVSFQFSTINSSLFAQAKKNKARINADLVNIIGGEKYLNIKASARINKKTVEVSNIELTIYQELNDQEIELGKTTTDGSGISKFKIENFNSLEADSTGIYNLSVSFPGNDAFKKASRSVSFRKASIKANWIVKDSINYVSAKLLDVMTDSSVAEAALDVRVDRLFRPLRIGDTSFETDENGEIEVAIEDGIPGVDGNLKLEVVLNESDDYGTVIASVVAPIGTVIVDESTYDQRTMWSPRGKTPIFLLTLTFSFIFVVWGIFIYLFINLVRIFKS
ncbi:hypothetical protein QWY87_13340 [Lutimonas halocynthiae]|uniref:hypothetical protein n=1 Tax=Lutimonas halocynthiae TaxID=1446477 RepID=UPI0025B309B4|nr:hypothetical protein [Lutimonas halocynthiae]MDN3643695.1 hypothetical protein [Lutimonas halocynthiae]